MLEKNDIRELSFNDLKQKILELGIEKFRAQQIYEWIWKKGVTQFSEMSNISNDLREKLNEQFVIKALSKDEVLKSKDKTIKVVFKTFDNLLIEGVLIPSKDRVTACISTQVGCALNCSFCATGKIGFKRNLLSGEIFDQFILLEDLSQLEYKNKIDNFVLMGMGEPLLNYENTLSAIDKIIDPKLQNISYKRITLSTAGIPDKIKKLADDNYKINLAISLHTADNEIRTKLMPINKKHDLDELASSIQYYYRKTDNRITFEYLLLSGINDSIENAKQLAQFCKIVPCKINIIEYNNVDNNPFKTSDSNKMQDFVSFLESKNIIVNVRGSRGKDIDAACGQLAAKKNK